MQFKLDFFPPQPAHAGRINAFYIIATDDALIEEMIPAYSAQIVLIVRGGLHIVDFEGVLRKTPAIAINAPRLRAARCEIDGPALLVGASLTHIGWQKLANLPADEVHDRIIDAADILTPAQVASLEQMVAACRAGAIEPADLATHLAEAIAAGPFIPRADHVAVVEAILRWLASGFDPAIADLYAGVDVSPRQLQRISRRFFGVPPTQVLKRFRALRAAMVLAQPGLSQELHDELMATYFDQAHLIRDIRRYTGRTPTQFRRESIARELLDPSVHGDAGAPLQRTGE